MGFEHISDMAGFDHMLFLVALCAVYRIEQWRQLLILVTAFTVGHSITLALASFGTLSIPSNIIEFLIPTTILLTALHNVFRTTPTISASATARGMTSTYAMTLFFGLIHGMGFSNYFRALLMREDSIIVPLFAFNIGIELGQLLIVAFIVGAAFLFLNVFGVKHRDWNVFISGAAAVLAIMLMSETRFW